MRFLPILALALAAAPAPVAAAPAERAIVVRAGTMVARPFIDAAKVGPVVANQPVVVVDRRGGWVLVETNGKRGWLRALDLRPMIGKVAFAALRESAAELRTGSKKKTPTTGVKAF